MYEDAFIYRISHKSELTKKMLIYVTLRMIQRMTLKIIKQKKNVKLICISIDLRLETKASCFEAGC